MDDRGRPFSLRQRLLLALLGAITLTWLAAAAYTYFDARHEINELLDAHLAQSASLIVAQVGSTPQPAAQRKHERKRSWTAVTPTSSRRCRRSSTIANSVTSY